MPLKNNSCNGFSPDAARREVNFTSGFYENIVDNKHEKLLKFLNQLLSSNCSRKYENLQDYLLEVSKTLGQRQSFYSFDFADILWKVQKWKKALPSVEIFYALKVNNDPLLLKLLVLLGISFDCATENEIQAVLEAGASPKQIIWAHTIKTVEGLVYARELGVDLMTFDCPEELTKIKKFFPEARLVLRIRPSKVKCKYDLSKKFGCSVTEAMSLLEEAKQSGMKVVGLSFHVGALCTDPDCFVSTIKDCRKIFDHASQMGCPLSVLDIGGGFFGASGEESIIDEVNERISEALEKYFPEDQQVRLIAEPGAYIANSAMNLVTTIIGKKTSHENGHDQKYYFQNNGIYMAFFKDFECYGIRPKPMLSEDELQNRLVYESTLYGPTCCSEDVIQKGISLPDMEIGEHLLWENAGAYNTLCSTFCGVPLPLTVYVFTKNERDMLPEICRNKKIKDFLKKNAVFIGYREDALI